MKPFTKKLVLENGSEFLGYGYGANVERVCEIVFNTSVVGYQEILSDPSNIDQIVVMAYPLIGNYGITDEDFEAKVPQIGGMVVRECNENPSNFRYTKTFSETLEEQGIPVRVLQMSGAKDPDEFIKKKGAEAFKALLTESRTGFEYKLESVLSKHDISQVEEKRRAAEALSEIISDYHSTVERELYSKRAGEALSLSADAIRSDAERLRKKKMRDYNKDQSKEAHATLRQFGNKVNPDAAKNLRAAYAEETLLGLLMIYPEYREGVIRGEYDLLPDDFFTEFGKRVFSAIIELEASGGFIYSLLGETFNPDEMSALEDMQLRRRSLAENGPEVFRSSAQILRTETRKTNNERSGNYTLEDKLAEKRRQLEAQKKLRGE